MFGRCHGIAPSAQRDTDSPTEPGKPFSRTFGPMAHPLELAACPPNDIGINLDEGRTQLRLVEVTVVGDPAADARVVHSGQLSQRLVAAMMKRPSADCPATGREYYEVQQFRSLAS